VFFVSVAMEVTLPDLIMFFKSNHSGQPFIQEQRWNIFMLR
jgi:hypothetical protein